MDLEETGWDGVDLIYLKQDRGQLQVVVKSALNLRAV
jgi:hypothetical protein